MSALGRNGLSKDLELVKCLLLTEFLETSVLLKCLVDIGSLFARLSEYNI